MNRRILLVEYYFTASRLFAFGIRSDLDRPAVLEIETDIHALRDEIARAAGDQYHERVGDLIHSPALQACVEPIRRWSSPNDLVCVVPTGPLFYVPLHAVSAEGKPLIVRNAISYAPSASALRYCIRRRHPAGQVSEAAVFGNPEGELPLAEKEAKAISRLFNTSPALRNDVTRDRVLGGLTSGDLFHFAGHAVFDDQDPLASGLVLANGDVLSARDLFSVSATKLRLVTLSGCVTGYSGLQPGDELLGLSRSLLHAGASSLLLTLWEIEDESGAQLMAAFYKRWIKGGAMKVDALRAAQLRAYERHPHDASFWAPFLLVGDWV